MLGLVFLAVNKLEQNFNSVLCKRFGLENENNSKHGR